MVEAELAGGLPTELRRVEVQQQEVRRQDEVVVNRDADVRADGSGVLLQQTIPQEVASGSLVRKLFGETLFSSRLMTAFDAVIGDESLRNEIIMAQQSFRTVLYGGRALTADEESLFQTVQLNHFNFAPVERMNFQMPETIRPNQAEFNANFQMEMRRGIQPSYIVEAPINPGQVLRTARVGQDTISQSFTATYSARSQDFRSTARPGFDERSSTEFFCFENRCRDQAVIRTLIALRLTPVDGEQSQTGSLRTLNSYEMAWASKNLRANLALTRRRDGRSASALSNDENTLLAMLRMTGAARNHSFRGETAVYEAKTSQAQVRVEGWMDESKRDIAMVIRLLPATGRQSFVALAQSNLASSNATQAILENSRFEQIGNIAQGTELSNGGVLEGSMMFLDADQKVGLKLITQNLEIILYFAD